MPARDIYHETVKQALIKGGWVITHDPLHLIWGPKDLYVDLGAEKMLAAEKGGRKIAVEVKSFAGPSQMSELEKAIGQFLLYRDVLAEVEPEREVYLAVHQEIFDDLFEEPIGKLLLKNRRVNLLVFDVQAEEITRWIP